MDANDTNPGDREAAAAIEALRELHGSGDPADTKGRPCPVPVRPGFGQAAYAAGCEDEWIDRMRSRYGGEW